MSLRSVASMVLVLGCSSAATLPVVEEPRATEVDESPPPHDEPRERPAIVELAAGTHHTCGRREDGIVVCWGLNRAQLLGVATRQVDRLPPLAVPGLTAVGIAAGLGHTCAIQEDRTVACWGFRYPGAPPREAPTVVPGLDQVEQIAAGWLHTCARRRDGRVLCWGNNDHGQLGDGTTTERSEPTEVPEVIAVDLALGREHGCAVVEEGQVACWGDNSLGQCGDSSYAERLLRPARVAGVEGAVELALGLGHTCARLGDGTVVCWGMNEGGQLGNGTTRRSSRPVAVAGLTDVVELTAGGGRTCARRRDGTVVCWGSGELGDGERARAFTARPPVQASLTAVRALAAGESHVCAAREDGTVACWGWNGHGQLGDGSTTTRASPVDVVGLAEATRFVEPEVQEPPPPPRVTVPSVLDDAIAAGYCQRTDQDAEYLLSQCIEGAARAGDARGRFMHGRLRAQRCSGNPRCVASELRLALAFEEDPASRALLEEAARLDRPCRDGALPEDARRLAEDGPVVLYSGADQRSYRVTNGARDCIADLSIGYREQPRVERVGDRALIRYQDAAVGREDGCTYEAWTDYVTVVDFELGELITLVVGGGNEDWCPDDPPRRARRGPRPIRVTASGDTLAIGRAPGGASPAPPTRWLVGQTLTLRDGVYTLTGEPP